MTHSQVIHAGYSREEWKEPWVDRSSRIRCLQDLLRVTWNTNVATDHKGGNGDKTEVIDRYQSREHIQRTVLGTTEAVALLACKLAFVDRLAHDFFEFFVIVRVYKRICDGIILWNFLH